MKGDQSTNSTIKQVYFITTKDSNLSLNE